MKKAVIGERHHGDKEESQKSDSAIEEKVRHPHQEEPPQAVYVRKGAAPHRA